MAKTKNEKISKIISNCQQSIQIVKELKDRLWRDPNYYNPVEKRCFVRHMANIGEALTFFREEASIYITSNFTETTDLQDKYKHSYIFIKGTQPRLLYVNANKEVETLNIDENRFNELNVGLNIQDESTSLNKQGIPNSIMKGLWDIIATNRNHAVRRPPLDAVGNNLLAEVQGNNFELVTSFTYTRNRLLHDYVAEHLDGNEDIFDTAVLVARKEIENLEQALVTINRKAEVATGARCSKEINQPWEEEGENRVLYYAEFSRREIADFKQLLAFVNIDINGYLNEKQALSTKTEYLESALLNCIENVCTLFRSYNNFYFKENFQSNDDVEGYFNNLSGNAKSFFSKAHIERIGIAHEFFNVRDFDKIIEKISLIFEIDNSYLSNVITYIKNKQQQAGASIQSSNENKQNEASLQAQMPSTSSVSVSNYFESDSQGPPSQPTQPISSTNEQQQPATGSPAHKHAKLAQAQQALDTDDNPQQAKDSSTQSTSTTTSSHTSSTSSIQLENPKPIKAAVPPAQSQKAASASSVHSDIRQAQSSTAQTSPPKGPSRPGQ